MSKETGVKEKVCIVVASNNEACLARNLMVSDIVTHDGVTVRVERGAPSAAVAYNRGLDATDAPIVVFAHQDVYLPPFWADRLMAAIADVEKVDPDWALIGAYGISHDGRNTGDVWTTSLGRRVGAPVTAPVAAQSFDELVIILRRDTGLRFDERLPFFHLYGTDIVQNALSTGRGAYVCDLPMVHNDGFHGRLGRDFAAGYHYLRRKWRARLPVQAPIVWITWHGLSLQIYRFYASRSRKQRLTLAGDTNTDPRVFSAQCGWENGGRQGRV